MLRVRREEDMERCVALLREVYEADRYPVIWPADPVRWLAGHGHVAAAWVEEDGDRLVGHLSLHRPDTSRARPQWRDALGVPVHQLAIVSRFFVAPDARGRGIGGALMSCAEQHAAGRDLRLALDVAEHNLEAIAFYARRGWRRVGTAELPLSADPWTLAVMLFVLPGE